MCDFLQVQGFREPSPEGWDFNLAKRVEEIKALGAPLYGTGRRTKFLRRATNAADLSASAERRRLSLHSRRRRRKIVKKGHFRTETGTASPETLSSMNEAVRGPFL
jgi:hypothetical protein